MKTLRKHLKGVSVALASVMLLASSSMALDIKKINEEKKTTIADVYFDDCSSCKYITIYNSENELVYDGLVHDTNNIKNEKLNKLLAKSDFLMSNQITNYYIITD